MSKRLVSLFMMEHGTFGFVLDGAPGLNEQIIHFLLLFLQSTVLQTEVLPKQRAAMLLNLQFHRPL